MAMIWPSPAEELVEDWNDIPPEPIMEVKSSTIPDMLVLDAERLANPETVSNRIVYDSIDPSSMHKPKVNKNEEVDSLFEYIMWQSSST